MRERATAHVRPGAASGSRNAPVADQESGEAEGKPERDQAHLDVKADHVQSEADHGDQGTDAREAPLSHGETSAPRPSPRHVTDQAPDNVDRANGRRELGEVQAVSQSM